MFYQTKERGNSMSGEKECLAFSGQAKFIREGEQFLLSTGKAEKVLRLDAQGRFYSEGYRDTVSKKIWMGSDSSCGSFSDEFFITVNGRRYEGRSGGYSLKKTEHILRSQGGVGGRSYLREGLP